MIEFCEQIQKIILPKMSIVHTLNGDIEGETLPSNVRVYRGVPYAKPPLGELRFKRPVPIDHWDVVLSCHQFKKIPPQPDPPGFYKREFNPDGKPEQSEDCLYLNIWAPEINPNKKYPVMFWIHGGGYETGYSYEKEIDGEIYAKKGCILISASYRLNVFGFLVHPILEKDGVKSGNMGIYDLILELQWVHDNIAAFGGDPENVTVFGHSAGAMLSQILVVSPLATNLFHKVILQSGGGFMWFPNLRYTRDDMIKHSDAFLKKLNVNSYEDLIKLPTEQIMQAHYDFPSIKFSAHIDGEAFPATLEECYDKKLYKDRPTIAGCANKEFGSISYRIFYHWNLNMVKKQLENLYSPVYMYYLTFHPPGDEGVDDGCFHGAELWHIFQTMNRCWRKFGEKDQKLSDLLIDYWINFAMTGNPNSEGLPQWTQYTNDNKMHLKIDYDNVVMESAKWF
ncbi:Carboxylesterase family protein [Trichomonas vaginalis G3]|uniref:Carboxylic ester hydrolase n=1 Tax=Trichomonas vaginalis (strain ATCC PRA-98 / G3) TaxID=412133 RepID=A2FSQ9_TRIV3|nr:acetylcholinesterase protein [Trichomonas vaginalis G3]EAX92061.1 Carboxylesterase family protein [Trichomonas vaginalis G3]KAI5499717.1 acetylcholinesterase protein [Trichomonas vaginalis G3]|eukprot:XP_001304991.1 Carboxylesterase family protein [Trichomonas vaginalis G3]